MTFYNKGLVKNENMKKLNKFNKKQFADAKFQDHTR